MTVDGYVFVSAGTHGGWKRVLDPLELELQMIESYHVGIRNQTWVLGLLQEKQVLLTTE